MHCRPPGTWTCTVQIPQGEEIHFRYCVALFVTPTPNVVASAAPAASGAGGPAPPLRSIFSEDDDGPASASSSVGGSRDEVKTIIRRWETDVKPRRVGCHDACDLTAGPDVFGRITPDGGGSDGARKLVQTGWLHNDTLVEIKLYERAVHIWKRKHEGKDLFVKVTPVDVAQASQQSFSMDLDESLDISETIARRNKSWPIVNVAVSK